MSATPSHPVAAPVDLKVGAVPKVLNLAEAAAIVRCSVPNSTTSSSQGSGVPHLPSVCIGPRRSHER